MSAGFARHWIEPAPSATFEPLQLTAGFAWMIRPSSILVAIFVTVLCGDPGWGAEPIHHEIEAKMWPESGRIEIVDRIALAGVDHLSVRLAPALAITRATLDGRSVRVQRRAGGWQIEAEPGSARTLRLTYGGALVAGPSHEAPFLGPDGGFLPAGSGWLPRLGDGPVTFDLSLEVPSPYKAVATGRITDESTTSTRYRARFVAARAGEEPSVFVGPYVIAEGRVGDVAVRCYFYEAQADLAGTYLRQAGEYLRLFEDRIGAYPYPSFHVVAAPLPVGLGFAGLTYVARQILHLPFMQQGSLAHEILHSWWGNAVAVAREQGNWAEGLTTYMADYALAEAAGADQARELRLAWLRDFAALPVERDQALRAFVAKRHDAEQVIGYHKAAFVFHMLRRRGGDAEFDAAIQLLWRRQRFTMASRADLQRAFEDAYGEDLGTFFEQWLERPGAPRLHLDHAHPERTERGYAIHLELSQGEPAYALPVPVEIETEGGLEHRIVEVKGTNTGTVLTTPSRPLAVAVDRDYDLFRHLAPGEAPPILRDVTLNEQALLLVGAKGSNARQLARDLAARMMDGAADQVRPNDARLAAAPLLLIGLTEPVTRLLVRTGLPVTPAAHVGRGSARIWTARRASGAGGRSGRHLRAAGAPASPAALRPQQLVGVRWRAGHRSRRLAHRRQPAAPPVWLTTAPARRGLKAEEATTGWVDCDRRPMRSSL